MAAQDDRLPEADSRRGVARHWSSALSPELIAILAVGVTLAGVMLTMMTVMTDSFARELGAVREDVRYLRAGQAEFRAGQAEFRAGQVELRERMTRVESKVDVLAGDWPQKRDSGTVE